MLFYSYSQPGIKMANILIIEDNLMNFEMARELLENAGHDISAADNANDGIKLAKLKNPDLILMDLSLPEMDGLEATKVLKQDPLSESIPVVAFTAMAMESDREKAQEAGCVGFISKPVEISAFVKEVEKYLKKQEKIPENQLKISKNPDSFQKKQELDCHQKYKWHNILIVDDNPMNAELLKGVLEQINQSSIIAYNGKKALELVNSEKFDLILLDIMMPEMSGFELIEHLKLNPKTAEIPVIFISALNETGDIVKGLDLGSYGYITKPYNIEELKAKILNILRIKDLQEQQKTFIAMLTHDLKTPIRAEMRALELLLKGSFGDLTPEQSSIIQDILHSSYYMFNMVDNLLSTYKYENDNIILNKEYIDINQLIKSCYSKLRYMFEEKNQEAVLDFKSENLVVYIDELELKRVIMNLFSNAIFYTPENGKIIIKTESDDKEFKVSFIDNGKGISEEDLANLFNKYTSHAKKFKQVGTGLGLYLSKKIINSHNGQIYVKSSEGKGSTFAFDMPIDTNDSPVG